MGADAGADTGADTGVDTEADTGADSWASDWLREVTWLSIRSLSAPYPLPIRSRAMWPVLTNGSSRASALSWKSNFRQQ